MKRENKADLLNFKSLSAGVKSTFVYVFASLLTRGLSIITMPIFTRVLSTSEMGLVTTYGSWVSIIYAVISLGVDSGSLNIAMMEYKDKRYEYISSSLTLSTISSILFFIIYLLFPEQIRTFLGLPDMLIWFIFIGVIVMPAYNMYIGKQRYEYNYKSIFWISVATALTASIASILAIVYFEKYKNINLGTIRLLSNNIISYGIAFIFYVLIFIKGRSVLKTKYIKFNLTNSLPLVIHGFSKQLLDVSDRLMISKIVGSSAVGIYGVLSSVSSISLIIWTAINNSIIPFMFNNIDKGDSKERNVSKLTESLLLFYGGACILITLIAPEIVRVLATEDYYSAKYLMPPLAAGVFFTALYNLFTNVLLFYKKSHLIMVSTVTVAIINIALNSIFISIFGAVAASYTTLFAYIILVCMNYYFMNKARKGRELFNIKRIVIIATTVTISLLLINLLYLSTEIRYTVIVLILLLVVWKKDILVNTVNFILKR